MPTQTRSSTRSQQQPAADPIKAFTDFVASIPPEAFEAFEGGPLGIDQLGCVGYTKVLPVLEGLLKRVDQLERENAELRKQLPQPQAVKAIEEKVAKVEQWVDVAKKGLQTAEDLAGKVQRSYPQLPPKPTALRLQALPDSGKELKGTRPEAVTQLKAIMQEVGVQGEVMQVYPPRAPKQEAQTSTSQGAAPHATSKGKPGMVFTMYPASAYAFMSQLRSKAAAEKLQSMGWSIRVHLPAVQYRCKCALYNEYKDRLQGKTFHYSGQYTSLHVDGGPTYKLSAVQLERIRAM